MGDNVGDNMGNDVGNRDDGGNNMGTDPSKGNGGDTGREAGGGLLVEDAVVAAAAAAAVAATAAAGAAYCWGCFLFIVKIYLCGIFMCEGNWQGHASPHTLVTLEVCRHTFGWGR